MIYEIEYKDLTQALVDGASTISYSSDGTRILIRSEELLDINAIRMTEEEMIVLKKTPQYQQPCKDCS